MYILIQSNTLRLHLFCYITVALFLMSLGVVIAVMLPMNDSWEELQQEKLLQENRSNALLISEWMRDNRMFAHIATLHRSNHPDVLSQDHEQYLTEESLIEIGHQLDPAVTKNNNILCLAYFDGEKNLITSSQDCDSSEFPKLEYHPKRMTIIGPFKFMKQDAIMLTHAITNTEDKAISISAMVFGLKPLYTMAQAMNVYIGTINDGQVKMFRPVEPSTVDPKLIELLLQKAIQKKEGVTFNSRYIFTYIPIPRTSWGMVQVMKNKPNFFVDKKNLIMLISSIIILNILCSIGFWFLSRPLADNILTQTTVLEKANAELEEEQRCRIEISRNLIHLLEKTRSDISRDIHDHTGQMLTTLQLSIENIRVHGCGQPQEFNKSMQALTTQIVKIQQSIREIALGLRPQYLDYLDFIDILEILLNDFRLAGLNIHFFHANTPKTLLEDTTLILYRLVQEALTNCLRHADAKNVYFNFSYNNQLLSISIEDDGHGFAIEQMKQEDRLAAKHLGLIFMRERVNLLNGQLTIDSAPGKGTCILIAIPYVETV